MNKNKSITFRLSEHDKKSITSRARQAKIPTSDFVRLAALGKEVKHIDGLRELAFELNKIGNNLNQMTVLMHQRRIDNPDLKELSGELGAVFRSIVECVNGGGNHSNS